MHSSTRSLLNGTKADVFPAGPAPDSRKGVSFPAEVQETGPNAVALNGHVNGTDEVHAMEVALAPAPVGESPMKRGFTKKKMRTTEPDAEFVEQALRIRKQLAERQARERFIFRPGESQILNYWDYLGAIMLLYTAVFTPFEVAFLPGAEPSNIRFILSRVLDAYFSLDLIAQFFISVRPVSTEEIQGHPPSDQEAWVDDHRIIAKRYVTGGWFYFDVFTLFPSVLDVLPHIIDQPIVGDSAEGGAGFLGDASILRTLRVLRFVKIFRVARVGRLLQRWAARVTLRHSTITVIKCLVYLLVAAHWYACIFALQASLHVSAQDTWLGKDYYAFCTLPGNENTLPTYCGPTGLSAGEWYVASFAWSTMIITGTGGTDFYPSSKSVAETILVTCLVLIGAILWTQILALFCDVATNSDPGAVRFRQTVDEMNSYLEMHKLPKSLRLRVREYLHAQRECQTRLETSKAVSALSPSLQVEVLMEVQKHFFDKVPFLRRAEAPCVVQISLEMSSGVFAPGELALLQHLYVIERGVVLYRGRVLTYGKVWGHEDVILDDDLLQYARTDRARAMSFMEYRGLSREALWRIVRAFPLTRKSLRRKGIYVALRRMMIDMLQDLKTQRGETRSGMLLNQISKAAHDEEAKLADRAAAIDALQRQAADVSMSGSAHKSMESRLEAIEARTNKSFAKLEDKLDGLTAAVEQISMALGSSKRRHRSESQSASDRSASPGARAPGRRSSPGGRAHGESTHGESTAHLNESSHRRRRRTHSPYAIGNVIGNETSGRRSYEL